MARDNIYHIQYYKKSFMLQHPNPDGDGPYKIEIRAENLDEAVKKAKDELDNVMKVNSLTDSRIVSADIKKGDKGKFIRIYEEDK